MKKLIIAALIATGLSACGEGGGEGGHYYPENTTRQANGIWHGTLFPNRSASHDLTILILDGLVAGVSYESGNLFSGYILGEDEFLSGEITKYDHFGEPVDDLFVEGVFHPAHTIDLGYSGGHDAGDIALDIDPMTYEPASLSILAGHYQDIDGDVDLLITRFGEVDGSDQSGCVLDGQVRTARSGINIYELVMTRTGCPNAANIRALATHYGGGVVDIFVLDSNEHMQLWEISETN